MKTIPSDLLFLTLDEAKKAFSLNDSLIIRLAEDRQLELLTFVKYRDIDSSLTPSELPDGMYSGCYLAVPPEKARELIETGKAAIEAFIAPSLSLMEPTAKDILFGILRDFPCPGNWIRPENDEVSTILIIDKDDVVVSHETIKKVCSEAELKKNGKCRGTSGPCQYAFEIPNGTEWRDIRIHFTNDKDVKVSIKVKLYERNFKTLGFAHKTSGRPKEGWYFLLRMAAEKGNPSYDGKNKKKISDLGKVLAQIFPGVPDKPFRRYAKGVGWQPQINLTLQENFADKFR